MDPIHATSEEISLGLIGPPGVAAAAANPPKSCLLASEPLVGESINATTAICHIEDPDNFFGGISVRVSLFVASPPLVSYVLAWSPDHDFSDNHFTEKPLIHSTHGGLILLSMDILPKSCIFPDYYVYRPGCGHGGAHAPSLELVPLPQPMDLRAIGEPCAVGLLSHDGGGSGGYYVAVLTRKGTGEFELCLFCSETGTWTIKKPLFLLEENGGDADFSPDKVIAVGGGGVLAFVSLTKGILIGDVLQGNPEFHHIALPDFYQPWTDAWLPPRDVIIDMSGDTLRIKVIDVVSPLTLGAWVSTTWVTTTTATSPWFQLEDWDTDSTLEARQLTVGDGVSIAELLPETLLEFDVKPNFGFLYVDMPMLSLHEDNIVCFLANQYAHHYGQVWAISVDMVKKKLLGVHPLQMGRFPSLFYSTISSHLNMTAAASGNLNLWSFTLGPFANQCAHHYGQVWAIVVDMVKKKLLGVHPLKMGRFPSLSYSTISI